MLSDPVLQPSALNPMAVLWLPVVLSTSAARPMPVLLLPMVMLGWDILVEKRWNWQMFAEKIPFGLIALFFGWMTWQAQPTLTSSTLFAVAYRGGPNAWIAGRGGAILRRTTELATVKISVPKIGPIGRDAPKLKDETPPQMNFDNDDIPKAVPPIRKPLQPDASIKRPAASPGGLVNTDPAFWPPG